MSSSPPAQSLSAWCPLAEGVQGKHCSTCSGCPAGSAAFATPDAVPPRQDGDATEAAGFGNRRSQVADGAVRVCAAPWPRLQ